jgi:TP901 family phage tail tape measure protein
MLVLETLVVRLIGDAKEYRKMLDQAGNEASKLADNISTNFQQIGREWTLNVTGPMAAFGAIAGKVANDYEREMAKIEGINAIARDQIVAWTDEILDIAPAFGKMPLELAKGMYYVTSAGIRGKQAMEVLKMSAMASSAGLGETLEVADALTSALNAFQSQGLQAGKATDIMTATVREGKLEAAELARVMGRLMPTAATMGVSFQDVAGAMATMSRTGMNAAQAAVSMNAIMTNLMKSTKQGRDTLHEYGLTYEMLREELAKPGGVVRVFRTLDKTFAGNDEKMQRIIPNIRSSRGVFNLLAQEADEVDRIMKSVAESSGDTNRAFQIIAKTGSFSVDQMLSEVNVSLIKMGKDIAAFFIPIMFRVIEAFKGLGEWWQNLSTTTKTVTMTIAALVAAFGPLLMVIGKVAPLFVLAFRLFLPQLALIKMAFLKVKFAIGLAMAVTAITPFMLGMTALVAILAIVVYKVAAWAAGAGRLNEQLERNTELTEKMNEAHEKQVNLILEEGDALKDPAKRTAFYTDEIIRMNKELQGNKVALLAARREQRAHWGGIGKALIDKNVEDAKARMEATTKALELLTNRAKEAKEAIDIKTPGTIEWQEKFKQQIDDLNQTLREEIDTFGLSKDRISLWALANEDLASKELDLTRKLIEQKEELERLKKVQDEARSITEKFLTPLQKYTARVAELDEMLRRKFITQEIYNAALKEAKKEMEGTGEKTKKLRTEIEKLEFALVGSADAMEALGKQRDIIAGKFISNKTGTNDSRVGGAGDIAAVPVNSPNRPGGKDQTIEVLRQIRDLLNAGQRREPVRVVPANLGRR